MKVLLFVGAGASVEIGVPGMRRMTEQLAEYLMQQGFGPAPVGSLTERLESEDYDMESLVADLDSLVKGHRAAEKWGFDSQDTYTTRRVKLLQQETEWFIQHACERIELQKARKLWAVTLRESAAFDVTIATTNYDRTIELASSSVPIELSDGFEDYGKSEVAQWEGFDDSGIPLLKMHGSTNWYRSDNGQVYKLRHPMALFGDLQLDVPPQGEGQNLKLNTAVVLPSREKDVRNRPYEDIRHEFRIAYREADIAFFVGSSLRDPDLESAAVRCSEDIPAYVVGPNASNKVSELPGNLNSLDATASQFLCSAFPAALSLDDLQNIDKYVDQIKGNESILPYLMTISDPEASQGERCESIEELAERRVYLLKNEIKELLEDEDKVVRRNALGLIPDSPDAGELVELAEQMVESDTDERFEEEVKLLNEF